MQTNLWNCLHCGEGFHPITHIPRILDCGHTFCSQCLQGILNEAKPCPIDAKNTRPNVQVNDLPINIIILEALPRLSTHLSDFCSRHEKPQDFICISEYQKICVDCEEECSYKRHNTKNLRDVETKAERKKKVLQNFGDGFDAEYDESDLLYEQEEALVKDVDETFESFKEAIKKAIRKFFEEQKEILGESYDHDAELKKKANTLLKILNEKAHNQNYFDALHTPLVHFKISSQKPKIDATRKVLEDHTETMKGELMATLTRICTLLRAEDPLDESGIRNRFLQEALDNDNQGVMEQEALDNEDPDVMEQEEEEIMPRIETEEDYLQAVSLFHAEIEENDRLILSFKSQQIETESILGHQGKLKTINKITLNINKSQKWKEAIECLQLVWNKLGKVIDLKIDFSFKAHAKEILEALIEQNNIWTTSDLFEFTIDLSSSPVEDEHVIYLYKKAISNMVNLQKLEIVLENTKITDHSVKCLAENTLANLANLTDFRFYVDETKISDDAIESLLASIHNKKINLTGLALGFDDLAITDKTIENIAKSIGPLASELRNFDLSVNNTNVSDDGLKKLFEAFDSQLGKLQEFSLDLGLTKVSNKGLKFFVQSTLPKMTSLEVFELFLNEQKKITNKIIKLIAKGLESSSNLKKICLELGGTEEISGTILADLEELTLKHRPTLETFKLYIAETEKIKVTEINDFLEKVEEGRTFQNLKNLSFCFSQLHVTDRTCELLANSIQQHAKNLQTLQLQLGKNKKITDKGLNSLSNAINQVLQRTKLTEFQLYLDSTKVTDSGLKVFSDQVVRSLGGVKSFQLYLILLPGVTDQGAEALFTDLATIAGSLRDVDISLYETKITDGCLKALSNTLWNAKPKLESFTLSIGKNENITDEGLEWLLRNFSPILQSLKSLKLNIEGTGVSQAGIGLLRQHLEEVPNALEKLKIEIGEDQDLRKMVQDLENHLI